MRELIQLDKVTQKKREATKQVLAKQKAKEAENKRKELIQDYQQKMGAAATAASKAKSAVAKKKRKGKGAVSAGKKEKSAAAVVSKTSLRIGLKVQGFGRTSLMARMVGPITMV